MYVVLDPSTDKYLKNYTSFSTAPYEWGTVAEATTFDTQREADAAAAKIGHGTVGVPR